MIDKKRWLTAVLCGLFLFLGGCVQERPPLPTVVPMIPTVTALPPMTDVPTATHTPTAIPTDTPTATATHTPTSTPTPTATPRPTATPLTMIVPIEVGQAAVPVQAWADLEAFWAADLPAYDYMEITERYGLDAGARTVVVPPAAEGETRTFLVDEDEIEATLVLATDNAYFWMGADVAYETAELERIADMLDTTWYPRLTDLFGTEWRPGVDGDPRFSILHFNGGDDLTDLGYFDSTHQYPADYDEYSNQQEMLFMNMSELTFGDDEYAGTLVHELQHLIQWNQDENEETWLDEGLSQLAEIANGLETAYTEDYLADSTVSLTGWQYEDEYVYQHYAASYLFMTYMWEQLGEDAIRALAAEPANGLLAVQRVLDRFAPGVSVRQFLDDWAAANLLDGEVDDPRYGYDALWLPAADPEAYVYDVPYGVVNTVAPFGVHYVDFSVPGTYTLSFAADTQTAIMPVQPFEGTDMWVAPGFDNVDARLTRPLDLRDVGSATLEFAIWYDIEPDYDFGFVSVSADGGETWEALPVAYPYDDIFGDALNGQSLDNDNDGDGWINESIPLDQWVGQQILLRFELVTDWSDSYAGMAVDAIGIAELGGRLSDDGWTAEGFVLAGNMLPQLWSLQWVQAGAVRPLALDEFNRAQVMVDIPADGATLIIMPQTPLVTADATYWLELDL